MRRPCMADPIRSWLADIQGADKVRMFNNGLPCGPNGEPCGNFDLCPGDPTVQVKVLAANLGTCSLAGQYGNVDSVVFKITHNQVTILFDADFGDATSDVNEDGAQKSLVDYYGAEMEVTVYKLAHHGDQDVANKLITCQAHRPKAIFVTANAWFSNRYPRCAVFERFIDVVGTLCRPEETDVESEFYCGEHPEGNLPIDDRLQRVYSCGESSADIGNGGRRTITDNNLAIYMTVPDQTNINIVKFTSDGVKWGFTNNIYPKIHRMHG